MPARNRNEPSSGLITQVFLPIQPMPAWRAYDAFLHLVLVDEDRRVERLAVLLAHPRHQRLEPLGQHDVIVLPARVAGDRTGSPGPFAFCRLVPSSVL